MLVAIEVFVVSIVERSLHTTSELCCDWLTGSLVRSLQGMLVHSRIPSSMRPLNFPAECSLSHLSHFSRFPDLPVVSPQELDWVNGFLMTRSHSP